MFEQFHALKAEQPGALLMFRMGDFYELFFDDAVVAAEVLDITLTSRNKSDPEPIPMAGVPHHAASGYVERLTDAGYRVAIAEQVEDPSQAKGLVRRAIVRVVTPGVTYDPTALTANQSTWMAAVCARPAGFGVAFLDVSTGELRATTVPTADGAAEQLARLDPREALLAPSVDGAALAALREVLRNVTVSEVERTAWRREEALREVREVLGVAGVEGYGLEPGDPAVLAVGAVLRYAREQIGGDLGNVHQIEAFRPEGFMVVDATTRRNLELTRTLIGQRRRGSLLGLVDRAATPMGSRLLADWLVFPLLDLERIARRQHAIEALIHAPSAREALRRSLKEVADIERIGARVAQGTAHARDLAGLRRSLEAVPGVVAAVAEVGDSTLQPPVDACGDVSGDLATWLVEEPPQSLTEGGLIRPEADAELAELTALALDGVSVISELEAKEREATGISKLNIKRNRVFGYFIEVTAANLHKVPERYLRKQTLSSCERYVTPELKELESKVLSADERRKALELERFRELRARVAEASPRLATLARHLAELDVLAGLAEVAVRERWVRPELNEGDQVEIDGGRHPMVEASLGEERFVPNDVRLDAEARRLIVLTGPNMSGKSTVLRQTALIVLLAQVGSFVPAERARIGLCDRIFTRVGAADDLRRGQSTFMVEMAETAAILHHATARSLVVLDEIGRGTSTFDGLAIAWAVAEDLVQRIGCRAMFATHYHELCELAELEPTVVNQSVAVTEHEGQILFLRRLKDGGASRSYGVQCARIAGLPRTVLSRAERLLTRFEKQAPAKERQQLTLFAAAGESTRGGSANGAAADAGPDPAAGPAAGPAAADPVRERLGALDPDGLSPREALAALYELRELADQAGI